MEIGLEKLEPLLDRFAKLPKPYRMGAVPLVVLLLCALYYSAFYGSASRELSQLEARRNQLERKLNEARSVAANLEAFEQELARLRSELSEALQQLPNSKELPVLLVDITTLGKNAGLEVTAFRPRQETPQGFYAEVPIEIEFSGRYHDIARFFDRVAKLPRIVNVENLQMSVKSASAADTVLKVSGTATTFRFLEQ